MTETTDTATTSTQTPDSIQAQYNTFRSLWDVIKDKGESKENYEMGTAIFNILYEIDTDPLTKEQIEKANHAYSDFALVPVNSLINMFYLGPGPRRYVGHTGEIIRDTDIPEDLRLKLRKLKVEITGHLY